MTPAPQTPDARQFRPTRLKAALVVLAAAAVLTAAFVGTAVRGSAAATAADELPEFEVTGRVFGPGGEPAAGAAVRIMNILGTVVDSAEAGRDGRFRLTLDKAKLGEPRTEAVPWKTARLVASRSGFGPAWVAAADLRPGSQTDLALVPDAPIRGRILDLGGRPVAGAAVTIQHVFDGRDGGLDRFLEVVRDDPVNYMNYQFSEMDFLGHDPAAAIDVARVTTDADGRFEVRGVGRERAVRLYVFGPGIRSAALVILTRPTIGERFVRKALSARTKDDLKGGGALPTVYAASFEHACPPSRSVGGTLRDAETGEPVSGVRVVANLRGEDGSTPAVTDAGGRFHFDGLAEEGELTLSVTPPVDTGGVPVDRSVPLRRSEATPDQDFRIVEGVVVAGTLTEAGTGRPVPGTVAYLALATNEYAAALGDRPGYRSVSTEADGSFRLVALPGPGAVAARTKDAVYSSAAAEDLAGLVDGRGRLLTANLGPQLPAFYHAVAALDPAPGAKRLTCDLRLAQGREVRGALVDAVGRPVAGAVGHYLSGRGARRLPGDRFTVSGLSDRESRFVYFTHVARRLGGRAEISATEESPVVVLKPLAAVTGRLTDAGGESLPETPVGVGGGARGGDDAPPYFLEGRTDGEGRFAFDSVLAGLEVEILAAPGDDPDPRPARLRSVTLREGERRDLGDVRLP